MDKLRQWKGIACSVVLFFLGTLNSHSQTTMHIDSVDFEKILLDGKTAFLNKATNEIITEAQYQKYLKGEALVDEADHHADHNHSIDEIYWDTLKVNPFKGVKVEKPFVVQFPDLDYASPVEGKMVVTSRFGRRRRGPHRGIDIDLVTGDNVMSILAGKVRFVGYSRGHGRTVVVRHDNDLETVYAHLSEYNVKTNDYVERGQIIGKGGTTGNARGSHLHMEIRYKGVCINPEYLLDFKDVKVRGEELWVNESLVNPLNHSSYYFAKMDVLETEEDAKKHQKKARKIHVVRKGDTLWGIARRNGMRVKDIVALNKRISAKSTLRIGQHLIISP